MEIGPGTGMLTAPLLELGLDLYPIEIDHESVVYLRQRWPELGEKLIEGDFLKLDAESFPSGSFHLAGNFPYNISSQIFFRVLEERARVRSVVCMLQKEVADRIAAGPGSKTYGILSVLLQAYYHVTPLFSVKPGSFHPPPRVTSGVIRLERNDTGKLDCDEKLFFRIVKSTFNQRRKMIRNSISSILLNLDGDQDWMSLRPEQVDVAGFVRITRWVGEQLEKQHHEQ